MKLEEARKVADEIISHLARENVMAVVAGGIHKGKPDVHDIDIVVCVPHKMLMARSYLERLLLPSVCTRAKNPVKVEFYIAEPKYFPPLLKALRSSRHEVIKGKLMDGLKFTKVVRDPV